MHTIVWRTDNSGGLDLKNSIQLSLMLVQAYKVESTKGSVMFHFYFKNERKYINGEVKYASASA